MELSSSQLEVANHHSGPLLVVSVAGSGKTTAVIQNLKNKFESGINLRNVFVTAFNRDAAKQLKDRISTFCHYSAECQIGTSHSLFLRIQKDAGLRYKRIYPDWEIKKALTSILKPRYQNGEEFSVYRAIVLMKNMLATPVETPKTDCYDIYLSIRDEFAEQCEVLPEDLDRCFWAYEQNKTLNDAIDMDDMLLGAYILFKQDEDRLKSLQDRFHHVIVDEYQDINRCQNRLFRMLAEPDNNIIAVGDDDQSIYAFRGASNKYILNFDTQYPNAKIIQMNENYRSQKLVLDLANSLIQNNIERRHKHMVHTVTPELIPYVMVVRDEEHEAGAIVSRIQNYVQNGGRFQDVAILLRVNMQQPEIEIAMAKSEIPYRVPDGSSFFSRSEVVSILNYLKLALDPTNISLIRDLANRPYRRISASAVCSWLDYNSFANMALESDNVSKYLDQIKDLSEFARTRNADEVIGRIAGHEIELSRWANSNSPLSADVRPSSTISAVERFSKDKTIQDVISEIERTQQFASECSKLDNSVSITTIHRSKGLEWPYVFIPGFSGNLIPHKNNLDIEEERRLLYVAITRAIRGVALLQRADDEESAFYREMAQFVKKVEIRHGAPECMGKTGGR